MRPIVLAILLVACSGAKGTATGSAGAGSDCQRSRSTDASGVITSDGYTGIVGQTFASSSATNDYFVLVRRGVARGDRLTVLFQQIGSSAPAAQVQYDVVALERATAWDDLAFQLPVKPIGFANSCWRVLVGGSDSGIILAIGP